MVQERIKLENGRMRICHQLFGKGKAHLSSKVAEPKRYADGTREMLTVMECCGPCGPGAWWFVLPSFVSYKGSAN